MCSMYVRGALLLLCWGASLGLRLPLEVLEGAARLPPSLRAPPALPPSRRRAASLLAPPPPYKTLYQVGNSEDALPVCAARAVCNKVDLYDETQPWIERQCRCPNNQPCKSTLSTEDGHTLQDRTRLYKLCQPAQALPVCRYFVDAAWTLTTSLQSNSSQQLVHCRCPPKAVTYLLKKLPLLLPGHARPSAFQYTFACSPQSRLRCARKEPCRLFTVRARQEALDEVNALQLCQCPRAHACPHKHAAPGVLAGESYRAEGIRTYSGYCMPHKHTRGHMHPHADTHAP